MTDLGNINEEVRCAYCTQNVLKLTAEKLHKDTYICASCRKDLERPENG